MYSNYFIRTAHKIDKHTKLIIIEMYKVTKQKKNSRNR